MFNQRILRMHLWIPNAVLEAVKAFLDRQQLNQCDTGTITRRGSATQATGNYYKVESSDSLRRVEIFTPFGADTGMSRLSAVFADGSTDLANRLVEAICAAFRDRRIDRETLDSVLHQASAYDVKGNRRTYELQDALRTGYEQ